MNSHHNIVVEISICCRMLLQVVFDRGASSGSFTKCSSSSLANERSFIVTTPVIPRTTITVELDTVLAAFTVRLSMCPIDEPTGSLSVNPYEVVLFCDVVQPNPRISKVPLLKFIEQVVVLSLGCDSGEMTSPCLTLLLSINPSHLSAVEKVAGVVSLSAGGGFRVYTSVHSWVVDEFRS